MNAPHRAPRPSRTAPSSPRAGSRTVLATCAAVALLAATDRALADEPGRIIAATVYTQGAVVERELKVPGGTRHVVMTCVPEAASVAALTVDGAPDLRVGEIVTEPVLGVDEDACRDAVRDPRAKALSERAAALETRLKADQSALDYLRRWTAPGEAGWTPAMTPAASSARGAASSPAPRTAGTDPVAAAESMRRATSNLLDDQARAEVELKAVKSSLDDLDSLGAINRRSDHAWYTARFDVATGAPATLRLRYRVDEVSWTPSYRASLDLASSSLVLVRLAHLVQRSGENWSGVAVTLSTTDPSGRPQGPLPAAWTIDAWKPEANPVSMARLTAAAPPPAPVSARAAQGAQRVEVTGSSIRPDVDLAPAHASVDQRSFETVFTTGRPLTVTATTHDQWIELESVKLPVTLRARVSPKQDAGAWLIADAPRPAGVWPVAWMELVRDGEFAGTARWGAGDEARLTLPFGRDAHVRVTVEHPTPMTAETGLFGGRKERRWADAYTVTNDHAAPTTVEVLEALPVSTNDNVKVTTVVSPEPTTRTWQHATGVASWIFTLAPRASQRIDIANTVSWPSDLVLNGL